MSGAHDHADITARISALEQSRTAPDLTDELSELAARVAALEAAPHPLGCEFTDSAEVDGKFMAYGGANPGATYGTNDPLSLHRYSDARVHIADDVATITTTKQPDGRWLSGFLSSRDRGYYLPLRGHIRIRAALPHAPGMWPALWLRHRYGGASTAEVDLVEVFYRPPGHPNMEGDSASQHLHFPDTAGTGVWGKGLNFPDPPGWHEYWVTVEDEAPAGVRFTLGVDDTTAGSYLLAEANVGRLREGDTDASWDIAINCAVTRNAWNSGELIDSTPSPQTMRVDWVRWTPEGGTYPVRVVAKALRLS